MPRTRLKVEQDPEVPIEKTVLAKAIVDISAAMQKLSQSGLNRRGIVALIRDSSPTVYKKDIITVLDALENLKQNYCR